MFFTMEQCLICLAFINAIGNAVASSESSSRAAESKGVVGEETSQETRSKENAFVKSHLDSQKLLPFPKLITNEKFNDGIVHLDEITAKEDTISKLTRGEQSLGVDEVYSETTPSYDVPGWDQIIPLEPEPLAPTTPMTAVTPKPGRKEERSPLMNSKHVYAPLKAAIELQREEQDHINAVTPLIITDDPNGWTGRTDSATLIMKLTVLEAEVPSQLIAMPNVYQEKFDDERKSSGIQQQVKYGSTANITDSSHARRQSSNAASLNIISDLTHEMTAKEGHNLSEYSRPTSRKTISFGMHVQPEEPVRPEQVTGLEESDSLPVAEPLRQVPHRFTGLRDHHFQEYNWETDDELVCQVHRCEGPGEDVHKVIDQSFESSFTKGIGVGKEIDFYVGTDILKDIWNNHINAERQVSLEIIDVEKGIEKATRNPKTEDWTLHKLGLGIYKDPALKPPPLNKNFIPSTPDDFFLKPNMNDNQPYSNLPPDIFDMNPRQHPQFINVPQNHNFHFLKSNSLVNHNLVQQDKSFPNVQSRPETMTYNQYRYPADPRNPYVMLPGAYSNSPPGQPHLVPSSIVEESPISPEDVFPHIHTLTTKQGTPDPIAAPVTHLLPPSVLPSIHEDAREGRIVETGQSTRIVLRLKPSSGHPNGEVISLPASKFTEQGTAEIVLDNGQKVSVRIKHAKKNQTAAVQQSQDDESHLSNFHDLNEIRNNPEILNREYGDIPITILRDAKTGIPIMALPGLKPSKETIVNFNKEKQFPEQQLPSLPELPLSLPQPAPSLGGNFNFNTNPNTNAASGTGFGLGNFNLMANRFQNSLRTVMNQINGATRMMENSVVDSFDNSVDVLRSFYNDVLPENYMDDSMTMLSIAAFLAFLGVRVVDVTAALGTSAFGKRALDEVENILGRDITEKIDSIWEFAQSHSKQRNNETGSTQKLFSSDGRDTESDNRDNSRSFEQRSNHQNYSSVYQELEEAAQIVDQRLGDLLQTKEHGLACLQKKLCQLSSAGTQRGGFPAFITPILSTGLAALHAPPKDVSSLLQMFRPLWMAEGGGLPSACGELYCSTHV